MEQELIEAIRNRRSRIRPQTTAAPSSLDYQDNLLAELESMVDIEERHDSDNSADKVSQPIKPAPAKQIRLPPIPPPPPPLPFSQPRVDLTPTHMRDDKSKSGIPHYSAIIHPDYEARPPLRPTSNVLRETRTSLRRPTNMTPEARKFVCESLSDSGSDTALNSSPIQASHPPPPTRRISDEKRRPTPKPSNTRPQGRRTPEEGISTMTHQDHALAKALARINALETTVGSYKKMMDPPSEDEYIHQEAREFDETKRRVSTWNEKVTNDPPPTSVKPPSSILKDNRGRKPPSLQRRKSDPQSTKSKLKRLDEQNTDNDDAKSVKSSFSSTSMARSMKSVLFRVDCAEDIRSEVSCDDALEVNLDDEIEINQACDKFTIHGPYIDAELNIFHEICQEYVRAAEITFSRKSIFSRTVQTHERVYAFIGSDRRSRLANRKDWNAISNDFKLLDYLFRSIIRSRSKKVKRPKFKLDHFTEGKTLHSQRFKHVMLRIFNRRDQLLKSIVGQTTSFESIV